MKDHKQILILVLLILGFYKSDAQYIVAGNVSLNDTYFDIIPDSVLYTLNVHLTPYPGESMTLDLNNDGILDVSIFTYGGGGLGGGAGGCKVHPLHSDIKVKMYQDSSGSFSGTIYFNAAKIFNSGDTIKSDVYFLSSDSYLWSTAYGAATAPVYHDWDNIGDKFIGFRFWYSPTNIRYGWIRVSANGSGTEFELTVKDFAINNNTNVGIGDLQNSGKPFVYPNPFNSELTINMQEKGDSEIMVYNLISRKVFHKKINRTTTCDLSHLDSGIYFYEIINSGVIVSKGKVIKE